MKQKFSAFRDAADGEQQQPLGDVLNGHVEQLADQLRMSKRDLLNLLRSLHDVMVDQSFVKQVLSINDEITVMSADN